MPRVVHVVVSDAFAGTERYVCRVAAETARRGWGVTVVGGDPARMGDEGGPAVRWSPGATLREAAASLRSLGVQDICHAHMTAAELVGVVTRRSHRGALISTRHFAQQRGNSAVGRVAAPWIARHLDHEIAISDFVAGSLERRPDEVVPTGVPEAPNLWDPASRTVLVLQRLEQEKDTRTAIAGWALSGLAARGWTLRVVGRGSQQGELERLVADLDADGVTFTGPVRDVAAEFAGAGVLLATALGEPYGLSVVEAMAAGVPVVAAAAGGHRETMGRVPGAALFTPGNARAVAALLRRIATDDEERGRLSREGRLLQRKHFGVGRQVDRLVEAYCAALERRPGGFWSRSPT